VHRRAARDERVEARARLPEDAVVEVELRGGSVSVSTSTVSGGSLRSAARSVLVRRSITTFRTSFRSVRSARAPAPMYPACSMGLRIFLLNAL